MTGRTTCHLGRRPRPDARRRRPRASGARRRAAPGAATGIGSLPHRSVHDAAAFALREYDLPAIPTLPRRSPAEGMIAQALVGIAGVTLGQYGSIAVDVDRLDPEAPVATDLGHDAFGGLRGVPRHRGRPPAARARQVAVRRAGHARRRADPRRRAAPIGRSPSPRVPCAPTSAPSPPPWPTALPDVAADRVARRAVDRAS